ncbi:MAG: signal peptide peptidase SppA [Thermodesulfovibrionales bacterium]|nr:signal peptide peptidase SppA [Thermodesulfovibrionales bacterium]MCG2813949.1 signal peptide peptidase SppA [Thermodesulfovibrionales bacterium]
MKKGCLFISGFLILLIVISVIFAIFQKNVPMGDKVAVVRIEGPIMDSKNTIDEIKGYLKDASIKAIVLRVDSPGGAVAPSQEIYEEVKKATLKKKVIVSMGSVAASGGYYISAPADRIIANPGTLTGSIGVIMEIPNIEGLMNKIGVKTEVIKSGRYKDIASAFRKMGKEERLILQGVLDDVHEQFIKAVSDGRKIPFDEVKKIADGRIFTGRQAMEARLVDELGTLEDAIAAAGRLAGIKGEPEVVTKKEKFSITDILRGKFPKELSDIFPTVKIKYLLAP